MKTILFFVNAPEFYLTHWADLVKYLVSKKCVVHLATSSATESMTREISESGAKLHLVPFVRGRVNPYLELQTIWIMSCLLAKIKPDLVHAITIKPVVYAGILSRIFSVSSVLAVTGLGYSFLAAGLKGLIIRNLAKVLYWVALSGGDKRVVFENQDDIDRFVAYGLVSPNRVRLVGGAGVDLDLFSYSPLPSGDPIVIFAGRLLYDKGVKEFVDAAYLLRNKFKNVQFVLAGVIDRYNPAAVESNQLDDWVKDRVIEYWGDLRQMELVIPKASIVVLPSYREGFPRILQEAAACGRPIVTTDVSGCRQSIINNQTGILVPPKDILALANAIEKLLKDQKLMEYFSSNGRQLAIEQYGNSRIAKKYLNIYLELVNKS